MKTTCSLSLSIGLVMLGLAGCADDLQTAVEPTAAEGQAVLGDGTCRQALLRTDQPATTPPIGSFPGSPVSISFRIPATAELVGGSAAISYATLRIPVGPSSAVVCIYDSPTRSGRYALSRCVRQPGSPGEDFLVEGSPVTATGGVAWTVSKTDRFVFGTPIVGIRLEEYIDDGDACTVDVCTPQGVTHEPGDGCP